MSASPLVIECKDREEWLRERAAIVDGCQVITASNAAAAIGLSRWKSSVEFYAEMKGLMPAREENEKVRWGRRLQRSIADGFAEDVGREIVDLGEWTLLAHPEHPWLRCTLDYLEIDRERGEGCLEIKNTTAEWVDEPPLDYQIQNQTQVAIRGVSYGTVAGLRSGWALMWADIAANPGFMTRVIEKLLEFQWRLKMNKPPSPGAEALESAAAAMRALYPKDQGETIPLEPDAVAIVNQMEALKAHAKAAEEQADVLKLQLQHRLGAATYGVLADGRRISWKTSIRHDPPREAKDTPIRTFRVLKA